MFQPWLNRTVAELVMAAAKSKLSMLGKIALIGPLVIILAAAGWYASRAWTDVSGPPMPATGYIAMALGVGFSLLVGCGLMALVFYSSRYGYDDQVGRDDAGE